MRFIAAAFVCLALAACNGASNLSAGLGAADNALARLAQNQIQPACAIISVAAGYFDILSPRISAANQRRYSQARAVIDPICANPPANTLEALAALNRAWFDVQAATVRR